MFSLNPHSKDFLDTLDLLLKLFGGIGGFYLFLVGLRRYTKDQVWKRHEFVAKEIKEFTSDRMVRNSMSMLDWGERYIELFPDKPNYDDRFAKVDRMILKLALQYHGFRTKEYGKDRFTSVEVAIRDNFDYFLSHLERFEQFIQAGLITPKELEPYLNYWVSTIADNIEADVRNAIYHYINQYGFMGTQQLFSRFNKDIKPKTELNSTRHVLAQNAEHEQPTGDLVQAGGDEMHHHQQ
ncbi:hypothetical protein HRH25_21805 [Flavisolibacter sp. BT320]|nr:hypothetical protein [Flavisolibacter longurius]